MSGGIIINKYGAVDAQEIMELIRRVRRLELIIERMAGIKEFKKDPTILETIGHKLEINPKVNQLPEDIQKMKELTKCDDYEYQTTPEKTNLVKIKREQAKDE